MPARDSWHISFIFNNFYNLNSKYVVPSSTVCDDVDIRAK